MGFLVPVTLFGWIPFVLFLFMVLPPRRAVITAFLLAWLFLPMAGYSIHGLPDYTKMSATAAGVVVKTLAISSSSGTPVATTGSGGLTLASLIVQRTGGA